MKRLHFIFTFNFFILFGFSQTIELQSFATGFSQPVEIAHAHDSRLFIVEKAGVIKIINSDGTVNSTPFLDISSIVGSGGERGLLGLAFAPDYATSGRFYVNYTDNSSTSEPNTIIARYTVSANPDIPSNNIANTNGTILMSIKQPFSNHNGGKIAFGPDGFLYISTGDGGSGGDPGDRAQDTSNLLGKLLRIDVSGSTYSIPTGNPFSNSANGVNDPRPEIFAIGLRNPWKFSFDRANNDLWIADVGQNNYEEVNKVNTTNSTLNNFGWRCFEGINHIFNTTGNCSSVNFNDTTSPVAEYPHVGSGCTGSITGGYIYRGSTYSNFTGKYFFADYCKRDIRILTDTGSGWSMSTLTPNITQQWSSFGEDYNGELYITGGSTVYKILDPNLSTNKHDNTYNFKLYTNVLKENVSIDLTPKFNDVSFISIYNIQSQKIKDITNPNQQMVYISTKNYSRGIYFIEINLKNTSKITKKFIVN